MSNKTSDTIVALAGMVFAGWLWHNHPDQATFAAATFSAILGHFFGIVRTERANGGSTAAFPGTVR